MIPIANDGAALEDNMTSRDAIFVRVGCFDLLRFEWEERTNYDRMY